MTRMSNGRGSRIGSTRFRTLRCLAAAMLVALGLLVVGAASASAEVVFPGGPLTVSIGPLGQCESSYASHGNNFFPPFGNLGDCGFFLAFPTAGAGQPAALQGKTFGFEGAAGPHLPTDGEGGEEYTVVSQSPVTGAGTAVSPYTQTTVFTVKSGATTYATVTETTTYVNGEPQFVSTFNVKNETAGKIYFRAIYAGDMYLLGNDFGTGLFLGGPPRFVGGVNPETGAIGGLQEVNTALPWSSFQEGCWNETALEGEGGRCTAAAPSDLGIWHLVRSTDQQAHAFNETVDPGLIDNAVGVEWDQLRETGLAAGGQQAFTIINRTQVPSNLQISPTSQTLTQGQTETITVTALDLAGVPYAGKSVHYTVSGANPQSGAVTLNSAGQAQISYVGHNAGIDTTQLFVDLAGTGSQTAGDPSGTATVTFLPLPVAPTPNSGYKIQSVKANSNGTITITFVPTQSGEATLEVTVPTGTIASREAAIAAAHHKPKPKGCKKGQVKIKGKCRPKNTVTGKVSAKGIGGVPLTLSVKPSSKIAGLLKKGKTVHLTATLTYGRANRRSVARRPCRFSTSRSRARSPRVTSTTSNRTRGGGRAWAPPTARPPRGGLTGAPQRQVRAGPRAYNAP